jgi:hypothetical protein
MLAREKLKVLLEEKGIDPEAGERYEELLRSDLDAAFLHNKIQAAIHFAYRGLPLVKALAIAVESGEASPIEAVF